LIEINLVYLFSFKFQLTTY